MQYLTRQSFEGYCCESEYILILFLIFCAPFGGGETHVLGFIDSGTWDTAEGGGTKDVGDREGENDRRGEGK